MAHIEVKVANGEDAGVVGEAEFGESLESPLGFSGDGETGSAVTLNWSSSGVFDGEFGAARIFVELIATESEYLAMGKTVASDFVPGASDSLDQLGKLLCDRTDDKEGGQATAFGQQFEKLVGIALDAAYQRVGAGALAGRGKSGGLVVLLEIDGKGVFHLWSLVLTRGVWLPVLAKQGCAPRLSKGRRARRLPKSWHRRRDIRP